MLAMLLLGCDGQPAQVRSAAGARSEPRSYDGWFAADPAREPGASQDGGTRAVLIYAEGTPGEQIYPISGETLTIGRGRENDIQVKNDGKLSRHHCSIPKIGCHWLCTRVHWALYWR
jgi:hypothetical protein